MTYNFSEIAYIKGITNIHTGDINPNFSQPILIDHKLPISTEILFLWECPDSDESMIITSDYFSLLNAMLR